MRTYREYYKECLHSKNRFEAWYCWTDRAQTLQKMTPTPGSLRPSPEMRTNWAWTENRPAPRCSVPKDHFPRQTRLRILKEPMISWNSFGFSRTRALCPRFRPGWSLWDNLWSVFNTLKIYHLFPTPYPSFQMLIWERSQHLWWYLFPYTQNSRIGMVGLPSNCISHNLQKSKSPKGFPVDPFSNPSQIISPKQSWKRSVSDKWKVSESEYHSPLGDSSSC